MRGDHGQIAHTALLLLYRDVANNRDMSPIRPYNLQKRNRYNKQLI